MRGLIVIAAVALAGCGTPRPRPLPPVEVRTITVDRPIPVPCVAAADIPIEPPRVGEQLNGRAQHDLDLVAASAIDLRAALQVALVLLRGCRGN